MTKWYQVAICTKLSVYATTSASSRLSEPIAHVVEKVMAGLNQQYGKEARMMVTRGNMHDYLGMTLDYSKKERGE